MTERAVARAAPVVQRLRCQHLPSPAFVDRQAPGLSWQVTSPRRGASQSAYQVMVSSSVEIVGDVWNSGRVASAECVLVPYAGRRLTSRERLFWSVRVWDDQGVASDFAPVSSWEMGLLEPADWQASWIAAPGVAAPAAVSYLSSVLHLDAPVLQARAYVTALGLYELRCNGARVGDARLTPGWTDYARRLQYQVLDLTDLLVVGDNDLTALLADGWYAGYIGFQGTRGHYGDTPQLLAQIEVQTTEGLVRHTTGSDWLAGTGPICTSDLLQGEHQDLTVIAGASAPVRLTEGTAAARVLSPAPAVRVLLELPAVTVERVGADTHRIDLGQNMVGWLRLRLDGAAGSTVTVRHAEILQPDGSLYVENLRTARAADSYVLAGTAGWVEPAFTFHGFRYAEVTGYPATLQVEDVIGVVCGSDLEKVGEFSCSDSAVNQLHSNIVWGARGNFVDIPTDCPQRDERMGWTGDAQVFAPTACYLFDTAGFFAKWLGDLTDAQTTDGSFPDVAPRVVLGPEGSPGWADAGVIVPSVLWDFYADRQLLGELFPPMRAWVDYVHRANPGLLWIAERGYDNGDWLAAHADTDKDLIASAYFARSVRLTAQAAEVLGRSSEATELHALADGIHAAFQAAFLLPGGRLKCETQTAYALSLRFGLLPDEVRSLAGQHLTDNVVAHDTHLTTGFLGVGQLLPALTEAGRADIAFELLLQDKYPSWLHAVRAGATTIWERWDGWTAEHGYGDPAMNSYNHYALGSVGEWLYRTVAGIGYADAGGRRLQLSPTPAVALEWASASHLSPYGPVRSGWQWLPQGGLRIDLTVPVGATATATLPTGDMDGVREAGHRLSDAEGVTVRDRRTEALTVELGSGTYHFTMTTSHTARPTHAPHSPKGSSHVR